MTTDVAATTTAVLAQLDRTVVGVRSALEVLWQAVLAGGHVLLEDRPGMGKTRAARTLAAATGLDVRRVQFTPDLLPADVTGAALPAVVAGADPASARSGGADGWVFRPGPVFTHLLLADEVNRAPAKTQAALLEAMQEQQVTVDGTTHRLPDPFVVVATQNPIESEGTYPLPEAQLDRFLVRVGFGYPDPADERRILVERARRGTEDVPVEQVVDAEGVRALRAAVERVHVDDDVAAYVVDLVAATRRAPDVDVGASPRGSLALLRVARARAATLGRGYVLPDDVKAVAVPALAHRLVLRPEAWVRRLEPEAVVRTCLDAVPTPPTLPRRG